MEYVNFIDDGIKFMVEDTRPDGFKPFLNSPVRSEYDRSLTVSVHRKPTQRSIPPLVQRQHYSILAKCSGINILTHGTKVVSSNQKLHRIKGKHFRAGLHKYPGWNLNQADIK